MTNKTFAYHTAMAVVKIFNVYLKKVRADRFQRLAGGANNGSEVVAFVVCDSMTVELKGIL